MILVILLFKTWVNHSFIMNEKYLTSDPTWWHKVIVIFVRANYQFIIFWLHRLIVWAYLNLSYSFSIYLIYSFSICLCSIRYQTPNRCLKATYLINYWSMDPIEEAICIRIRWDSLDLVVFIFRVNLILKRMCFFWSGGFIITFFVFFAITVNGDWSMRWDLDFVFIKVMVWLLVRNS